MSRGRFDEIGKKSKRENDVLLQTGGGGRRHIQFGPPGTLNSITPCAACKLLRRRCAQECPFSPYFSPHEPQKFAVVHKVFGASNVAKMLMEVPESQRADAANSLVYEANVRLRDPVYGCMGAISALQQQIQVLQAQINAVRAEMLKYKFSQANHHHHHHHVAIDMNNNNNNNITPASCHHHLTFPTSGTVSIVVPPPEPLNIVEPPTPPPPPAPHSSVSSSMHTQPSGSNFSSTSNENVSFFG